MVYEFRTYTLAPGKMPEYLKAAETIGRPARGNNYGVNHGYWTSEFGALNQIWHLWKYDSYEERTRLRTELQKNKDWTEKYIPIVRTCVVRQDLRLMNTVVDIKPDDVYWCAADIGWVTGHSYIVYGPLANATTGVLYEGAPDAPTWDRWWEIIEQYKVSILYCAPTAIRAFMKQGEAIPEAHDLSSLRLLGSVGEPINPEAWRWYKDVIGGGTAPVVDTWWQTETGQILISPLPGVTTTKPGSATFAMPGIDVDVVDSDGKSVPLGGGGYLVLKRPWPGMLRGIYGDPERYRETYWSRFPGMYFAGDGAKRDEEGYIWLLGRVDDVMNIAGHRISTTEVESALVDHRSVAEAAVVGKHDPISGQAIFAFVILKAGQEPSDALGVQLREHVAHVIGPIARPKFLMFVPDLPKTRSGKIMRRLLRDLAEGRVLGDVTTLADTTVVDAIRASSGTSEED